MNQPPKSTKVQLDPILPSEMAQLAERAGVRKANLDVISLLVLAVLAGAFIALGAVFATSVTAGLKGAIPYGLIKLLGGLVFCLGLILVIVGGAELFTGNALIVMAWAGKRIKTVQLLRNWVIVYIGNFIGALGTVLIVFFAGQYKFGQGAVGQNALEIASVKCKLGFAEGVALGILCNALVCLAVWLCYSARTTTDKVLAIIFPITAFVAAGFEHSVANMYFIPAGLLVKDYATPDFWAVIDATPVDYVTLSWSNFLVVNLIPVTIGNMIGGVVLVGLVYWFIYIKPRKASQN
ncbi:MAG: formate transporter FocA [Cyclobacteriaceae bacterium]